MSKNSVKTVETPSSTPVVEQPQPQVNTVPEGYRLTSTGRPTLVGTRKCKDCGRPEFNTKKFEETGNPEDLNERYTLCKGVCVYCYAKNRNKKNGTSLTVDQLNSKIQFYTNLLNQKQGTTEEVVTVGVIDPQ